MRTACFDTAVIQNENKEIIGISLGYDHCAEHEWGVKGIKNKFGLPTMEKDEEERITFYKKDDFYYSHKVTKIPQYKTGSYQIEDWKYLKDEEGKYLLTPKGNRKTKKIKKTVYYISMEKTLYYSGTPEEIEAKNLDYIKRIIPSYTFFKENEKEEIPCAAAWDESCFCFAVDNKEVFDKIVCILSDVNNLLYGVKNPNNPFGGATPTFLMQSEYPIEFIENYKKRTLDVLKDTIELHKSGVKKLLKKSGKDWFSLDTMRRREDGTLIVWLNPIGQDKYNSGWFTIEELEQWAKDKGPVIKKGKA